MIMPCTGPFISRDLFSSVKYIPAVLSPLRILVRQISVKSGVSTALYDKGIKLGTLILDIMENIFKIRGNPDILRVSQERMVNVVGLIIQNGRRQRYFFGVETYSIIV